MRANWNYPSAIRFGAGRIAELADACKTVGMSRPLLVTDPGVAGLTMIAAALDQLKTAGLGATLFSDIRPNPVRRDVESGLAVYRAGKHDGVIAFGGGSALDAGKAIAFLSGQSRPIWDFEDVGDNYLRADANGIAPTVAVPTTAGTGSEVGRVSVILDEETHTKRLIFHPRIMPELVIEDPALTIGLPPHITAATGMDALAHCLEAFCTPMFHPMADGIALEGMRLIKEFLPRAVRDGTDLEARGQMMIAATMGAAAFQKGLGAIHSLSHPIGAFYDKHHGLLNAIVMPYVLAFNRPAIEEKTAHLARYLGLAKPGFAGVQDWVLGMRREIGIPHALTEIAVDDSRAEEIARAAEVDPTAPTNPVPLDAVKLRSMFLAAVTGRV